MPLLAASLRVRLVVGVIADFRVRVRAWLDKAQMRNVGHVEFAPAHYQGAFAALPVFT